MNPDQMRDASLLELFQLETRTQVQVLNNGLLALEHDRPRPRSWKPACARRIRSRGGAHRRPASGGAHRARDGRLPGGGAGRPAAPAGQRYRRAAAGHGSAAARGHARRRAGRGDRPAGRAPEQRAQPAARCIACAAARAPAVRFLPPLQRPGDPPPAPPEPAPLAVERPGAGRRRARAARHGRYLEQAAGTVQRDAGRIALDRAVQRVHAAAAAHAGGRRASAGRRARGAGRPDGRRAGAGGAGRRPAHRRAVRARAGRTHGRGRRVRLAHGASGAALVRHGAGLPHAALRRWPGRHGAHGARPGTLAGQAGATGDRGRIHSGRPRHPGQAGRAVDAPAAQCGGPWHRDADGPHRGRQAAGRPDPPVRAACRRHVVDRAVG